MHVADLRINSAGLSCAVFGSYVLLEQLSMKANETKIRIVGTRDRRHVFVGYAVTMDDEKKIEGRKTINNGDVVTFAFSGAAMFGDRFYAQVKPQVLIDPKDPPLDLYCQAPSGTDDW